MQTYLTASTVFWSYNSANTPPMEAHLFLASPGVTLLSQPTTYSRPPATELLGMPIEITGSNFFSCRQKYVSVVKSGSSTGSGGSNSSNKGKGDALRIFTKE